MIMDYSHFKSGSDIRGIAIGDENQPLFMTDEMVKRSAAAFVDYLKSRENSKKLRVAVGHDSRLSAQRIKNDVIEVLLSYGIDVDDCGLSSTPAMFMTTVKAGCDGAIQITASHHPKDRNGLKFFTVKGGLDGNDIARILENAGNRNEYEGNEKGTLRACDFMSSYSALLRDIIIKGANAGDKPLSGLKIIVDAGNGVGGFYANDVLKPLGADTSGSLFLEPDGNFPNHAPNPENAEAMQCITEATKSENADFGIIFDTDVDRAACVGKGGFPINRNRLVALASKIALSSAPGGTIVTDSVTSDGLAKFITANGGKHLRFKRGYKNVINKQIELCSSGTNCPLAMETSGHAAFSENYFLDDGAYLITKLLVETASLAKQGKRLEDLIKDLEEPVEEKELRFKIKSEDFRRVGEALIEFFAKSAPEIHDWKTAPDNNEGIRINSIENKGWFLLRLSVHDPIIVLNCESNTEGGCRGMCKKVLDVARRTSVIESIDITELKNYTED